VQAGRERPVSLNIGDQVLLLLLQRVHDGHITECCGFYFDEDRRVSWHTAEVGFQTLTELGRIQLTCPPGSGALRTAEYEPGELVYGVHVGLSAAERRRRASLTERGLTKYRELRSAADRCLPRPVNADS
jgi:hypothetical protein